MCGDVVPFLSRRRRSDGEQLPLTSSSTLSKPLSLSHLFLSSHIRTSPTGVDPGRSGLDYCSTLTPAFNLAACKFSWRPGAVFAFVSLGLGAVSFILDSRILTGDGANFCPYASNPKEDELEKGQIEPDESKEDPDEVADEEGPVDSASVLSSDLEIEIEPLQVQEEAATDEPQSPYRVPGSPLGGISRWLRASPKASTDELTDVKLGE